MTKNPFYNALIALLYIMCVVALISFGSQIVPIPEESYFFPVGMLSLLVVSAAFMAYTFFYQPVMMLLDGKRKEAVKLFWQTIAIFAGVALIIFLIAMVIIK